MPGVMPRSMPREGRQHAKTCDRVSDSEAGDARGADNGNKPEPPVSDGSGLHDNGEPDGTRTRNPQIDSLVAQSQRRKSRKGLRLPADSVMPRGMPHDHDLDRLIRAWPHLPDRTRKAILEMIQGEGS